MNMAVLSSVISSIQHFALVYYNFKSFILTFNKTFLGGPFIQLYPSFDFAGVKSVVATLDLIIYQVTKSKLFRFKLKQACVTRRKGQTRHYRVVVREVRLKTRSFI